MLYNSPLRYPGGKRRIAGFMRSICDSNDLHNYYVEPFAGGASIAINLLLSGTVRKVLINDKDRSIYAFWHSVTKEPDRLCSMISNVDISLETREVQKSIQKNKNKADLLELGFSTLFLNRTNRSGILNAGAIGGIKQCGNYKIDCRFNKDDIIKRILQVSHLSSDIVISNLDAEKLLLKLESPKFHDSMIYLDPPYFVQGSSLYMNSYKYDDHKKLADRILNLNNNWVVSYDNVPQIVSLYSSVRHLKYDLEYFANEAKIGKEIMFFSDGLKFNRNISPLEYNTLKK